MGFSLTKVFFYGSMVLPYLLVLAAPRTTDLGPLVGDFFALITLVVTSLVLAVWSMLRQRSGWGLLYPVGGLAAILLFFIAFEGLRRVGDYLDFFWYKSQMEAHLGLLGRQPAPADTLRVSLGAYCGLSQGACYDVQPPGILLVTTGGEPSRIFWGYAYSPTDAKPYFRSEKLRDWYRLTGHWYRWERPDTSD